MRVRARERGGREPVTPLGVGAVRASAGGIKTAHQTDPVRAPKPAARRAVGRGRNASLASGESPYPSVGRGERHGVDRIPEQRGHTGS